MADKFVVVAEASATTGYSREYIRLLARSKTIPSKKVGTIVLVDLPALVRHQHDIQAARAVQKEGDEGK